MLKDIPLLPLRDVVVYPHMVIPLFVGREKSIAALEAAMSDDKQIMLVAQRNASDDDPGEDDIYRVGMSPGPALTSRAGWRMCGNWMTSCRR